MKEPYIGQPLVDEWSCQRERHVLMCKLSVDMNLIPWVVNNRKTHGIFPALFFIENAERAPYILRKGPYGFFWQVCISTFLENNGLPRVVTAFPAKSETLIKKGFMEGLEVAPSEIKTKIDNCGFLRETTVRRNF